MIYYGKKIESKISTGKRHVESGESVQGRPGRSLQNPRRVESHKPRSSLQHEAVATQRQDVGYQGTKWSNTGFFYMGGYSIVNL